MLTFPIALLCFFKSLFLNLNLFINNRFSYERILGVIDLNNSLSWTIDLGLHQILDDPMTILNHRPMLVSSKQRPLEIEHELSLLLS